MAKSLRSKWKRKMRAIKRVRYGEKELAKLKERLGIQGNEVEMGNINDIVTVVDPSSIPRVTEVEDMEDDGKVGYNPKTLLDQNGHYPVWLSGRKRKKMIKCNRVEKAERRKTEKKNKKASKKKK